MTTFTSWDTELYHYGTPGMEHGKRLYQNKDGSLTPLGRIHYGYGQIKERRAQRKEERKKRAEIRRQNRPKKLSEMTDDEIRSAIARKNLEYEYRMAGGGGRLVEAAKRIGEAYDKKKQRDFELEKVKVEATKAQAEAEKAKQATKTAAEQAKAAKQRAKEAKNKHATWLDRRIIAKQLKTTNTTAELEEAKSHRMATQAKLEEAQARASTVEKMLKRNTLWDYIKGTAVRNVVSRSNSDDQLRERMAIARAYIDNPQQAQNNRNNQNSRNDEEERRRNRQS